MYAELVVLGQVVEVETDTVEAGPYPQAPPADVVSYRVAVVRVAETLVGPGGRTRVRVGFSDGAEGAPSKGPTGCSSSTPTTPAPSTSRRQTPGCSCPSPTPGSTRAWPTPAEWPWCTRTRWPP